MKRRSFFGFMAGAAAIKPDPTKLAMAEMENMKLHHLSMSPGPIDLMDIDPTGTASKAQRIAEAIKQKAKYLAMPQQMRDHQKKNIWMDGLDPNIAACRSIAMTSKIRISREIAYKKQDEHKRSWFDLVIGGYYEN